MPNKHFKKMMNAYIMFGKVINDLYEVIHLD